MSKSMLMTHSKKENKMQLVRKTLLLGTFSIELNSIGKQYKVHGI